MQSVQLKPFRTISTIYLKESKYYYNKALYTSYNNNNSEMGKTTISVQTETQKKFVANKGMYEGEQGTSFSDDAFLNVLLSAWELGKQAAQEIESGQLSTSGGNE